ncbi:entericidin A/B family lipoprotein [Tepidicaulis sp. LMO-SS28]|uniref:entericidin A/B family lipoprotein n=1 Tax=Tepidicaulis sp. LMO-SS28 TaxID=3447455 RepID=UPI003EE1EC8E
MLANLDVLKKTLTLGAVAACLMLGACNTVEGFGQDMQKAGDNISDEARENK